MMRSCIWRQTLTELADVVLAAIGASGLTPYNALHVRVEGMRKAKLLVFQAVSIQVSACACAVMKSRVAKAAHILFTPALVHLARKVLAAFLSYRDPCRSLNTWL